MRTLSLCTVLLRTVDEELRTGVLSAIDVLRAADVVRTDERLVSSLSQLLFRRLLGIYLSIGRIDDPAITTLFPYHGS